MTIINLTKKHKVIPTGKASGRSASTKRPWISRAVPEGQGSAQRKRGIILIPEACVPNHPKFRKRIPKSKPDNRSCQSST